MATAGRQRLAGCTPVRPITTRTLDHLRTLLTLWGVGDVWHPKAVATAVVLALLSAACYGTASAFQHQATTAIAPEHTLTVGLLTRLVRDWRWLLGNLLDIVGFALQFLALRHGALTLVEPLLVSSLLFSFPLRDLLARRKPSLREALAAAVTALALGGFLVAAGPRPGDRDQSVAVWGLVTILVAAVVVGSLALAQTHRPQRGIFLAAGSGAAFGYMASMAAATWAHLSKGVGHALTSPDPYALIAGGIVGIVLMQSAFHAGHLGLSLPTLTVAQPLVAIAIGLGAFNEIVDTSAPALLAEAVCLVAAVAGVFSLAREGLSEPLVSS
jgi:drug/metabolite transporter (DMT)-like permease